MSARLAPLSDPVAAGRLRQLSGDDLHFEPDFIRLYGPILGEPLVFLHESSRGIVVEPVLVRRLPPELAVDAYDAISPYPFGGPLASDTSPALLEEARAEFTTLARSCRIVSLFRRYHPLQQTAWGSAPGELAPRECFAIDLQADDETRARRLTAGRRRNIVTARRSGVTVSFYPLTPAHRPVFARLYNETMARRNADDFYVSLGDSFLSDLCTVLGNRITLGVAEIDGVAAAAALFLKSASAYFYFLGGSAAAWQRQRPNDLLFWEASRTFHARSARWLVLGGGVTRDDGLSRFKASFGSIRLPWATEGVIFMPELFRQLVDARCAGGGSPQPDPFFPSYRARRDGASPSRVSASL